MKKTIIAVAVTTVLMVGCGPNDAGQAKTVDLNKEQIAAIENRITPFSQVSVLGESPDVVVVALPGEAKYAACSACHGTNGGGGMGPALAGAAAEYIVQRLIAYRNGEKVGGQSNLMWGQAAGLSDQDIDELAEYVETL